MRDSVDLIFLAPGLGTGGTERHLAWLLPSLQHRGMRLEVWNAGPGGAAEAVIVLIWQVRDPEK